MTRPTLSVAEPWFTIEEVEPGIHLITEPHCHRLVRANAFLIQGIRRDILVDSGMGIGSLRQALTTFLDKPLTIVTTHSHVDHMGGHADFPDAVILVHPLEAGSLAEPTIPRGLGFDGFSAADRTAFEAMGFDTRGLLIDAVPYPDYDPDLYQCRGVAPTSLLREGDVLDLGNRRLSVLHLPGHSPGGIGLWDAASGTLFSGDTLYDGVLIDTIAGADRRAYAESLRRIRGLPVRLVHGGHKPSFGRDLMDTIIDRYLAAQSQRNATAG